MRPSGNTRDCEGWQGLSELEFSAQPLDNGYLPGGPGHRELTGLLPFSGPQTKVAAHLRLLDACPKPGRDRASVTQCTLLMLENIPASHNHVFSLSSHQYDLYKLYNTHEQVCFQSLTGRNTPFGHTFHGQN